LARVGGASECEGKMPSPQPAGCRRYYKAPGAMILSSLVRNPVPPIAPITPNVLQA